MMAFRHIDSLAFLRFRCLRDRHGLPLDRDRSR